MAKGCFHCLRILVILFNLLFVLIGCAILGVAIFLYVDSTVKGIKENMEDKKLMVDILLFSAIGIGGITIIVSTFGCCGAYHESECLLGTYFFCLFVIVTAEIAAGVLGYLKYDQDGIKEILNKSIQTSIEMYMKESVDANPPEHLKQLQRRLQCCGASKLGGLDYATQAEMLSLNTLKKVARACLPDMENFQLSDTFKIAPLTGCTDKIYDLINNNKLWVAIVCLVVAGIELLSMIIAMSLCCTVRRMESGYIGVST